MPIHSGPHHGAPHHARRTARVLPLLTCLLLTVGACSPALDWRDARLAGAGLSLLFPCKPQSQSRVVEVAGQPWSAALLACDAAGMTFAALALAPPPRSESSSQAAGLPAQAMDGLAQDAVARWGPLEGAQAAPAGVRLPDGVQGRWTRHARAAASGPALRTQALFMATPQGLVQLSVHGERLSDVALENFFGQLKVMP